MRLGRCPWIAAAAVALASSSARADAPGDSDRAFYRGLGYGSESLYNPGWVLLNRGYDALQLRPAYRQLYGQPFLLDARVVGRSMVSPFEAIDAHGWGRFVTQEILPLSYTTASARWAPNYGLHLIGGGQTYAELREWMLAHDASPFVATALSLATVFSAAFVNETIENNQRPGPNTDALADLYIFDLAGVILFSFDGVKRFFSRTIQVADWSLQPAFTFPRREIHNQGNYYALKWHLPFFPRLGLFGYIGMSTMGGVTVRLDGEHSLSAAAGIRISSVSSTFDERAITLVTRPTVAVFWDRNQSLLASVQVSDVQDYFVHVNVYPNAIVRSDPGFGLWTAVGRDGATVYGLSVAGSFGLGVGFSSR